MLKQLKERKVKKVKEMQPDPHVSSENALLAEKSFLNETGKPVDANGYHLEWTEQRVQQKLPSQDFSSGVSA